MTPACAVPRCQNAGTVYLQDARGEKFWFCAPCAGRDAKVAERNGARGYVPVPESDAQLRLSA